MDYVKITNYSAKDSLLSGDPNKLVKGSEIGADFDAVAVAVATKADEDSAVMTNVDINSGTIDGTTIGATTRAAVSGTTGNFNNGLTVSGAAFTSRGITDNATSTALTLANTGITALGTSGSTANIIAASGATNFSLRNTNASTNLNIDFPATSGALLIRNHDGATATELGRVAVDGTTTLGGTSTAPAFKVVPAGTPATSNYVSLTANNSGSGPSIRAVSLSDANASLVLQSHNSGGFFFQTQGNTTPVTQVQIQNTTSATNYITLTGSNGGNPTIGTSGGSLALAPNGGFCYLTSAANAGHNISNGTVTGIIYTSADNTLSIGTTSNHAISLYANNAIQARLSDTSGLTVVRATGLGYGTGAGGTVTQGAGSGKATAITSGIDKPTGKITMNSAALAAGATVAFSVTNSTVAITDTIVIHAVAGSFATNLTYQVWIDNISSGSFVVAVKNISAGSLSEALALNFAVIKGATS